MGPCVVALRFLLEGKGQLDLLAGTTGTDDLDNWGGYWPLCNEQRAAGTIVDLPNRVD